MNHTARHKPRPSLGDPPNKLFPAASPINHHNCGWFRVPWHAMALSKVIARGATLLRHCVAPYDLCYGQCLGATATRLITVINVDVSRLHSDWRGDLFIFIQSSEQCHALELLRTVLTLFCGWSACTQFYSSYYNHHDCCYSYCCCQDHANSCH